jgi:polyisoprenoid-binding protein YceI
MKKIVILSALALASLAGMAQTTWVADKAHSKVGFTVTHLMVSDVDGSFKNFDAKVVAAKPDFSDATIDLTADIASVNTDNDQRDTHLKSPDFFDAAKYNQLVFKSTSFKKVDGKKYQLTGNITIHGVTKPITLDATLNGIGTSPFTKKPIAGFKVTGTLKRSDFGIGGSFPSAVVSDEVALTVNVELDQQ